jgi:hypothetical protein
MRDIFWGAFRISSDAEIFRLSNMLIFLKVHPAWFLFAILSVSLSQGQAHPSVPSEQASMPTISAAPSARVVPPPPNYGFPDGQTYVYEVEWHLFNAGTA